MQALVGCSRFQAVLVNVRNNGTSTNRNTVGGELELRTLAALAKEEVKWYTGPAPIFLKNILFRGQVITLPYFRAGKVLPEFTIDLRCPNSEELGSYLPELRQIST